MCKLATDSQRQDTLNNPIRDLVCQLSSFSGTHSNMYEKHYTVYTYACAGRCATFDYWQVCKYTSDIYIYNWCVYAYMRCWIHRDILNDLFHWVIVVESVQTNASIRLLQVVMELSHFEIIHYSVNWTYGMRSHNLRWQWARSSFFVNYNLK
jgi:hypothetical protein